VNSPGRLLELARDVAKAVGPIRALALAPRWLLARRMVAYTHDLTQPIPEVTADLPAVYEELQERHIAQLATLRSDLTESRVRAELEAGHECTVGVVDGEILHCRWGSCHPVRIASLGLTLCPQPGDWISFGIYTRPHGRGRHLYGAIAVQEMIRRRDQGFTRAIGMIAWWNRPSRRTAHVVGWEAVGEVTRLGLPPVIWHRARGAAYVEGDRLFVRRP
jgi:hypothetical protein